MGGGISPIVGMSQSVPSVTQSTLVPWSILVLIKLDEPLFECSNTGFPVSFLDLVVQEQNRIVNREKGIEI